MIHLEENEKIVKVLHRHWVVIAGKFAAGVLLAILPLLIVPLVLSVKALQNIIQIGVAGPLILFLQVIYLMIIVLGLFVFWADYYMDMWVITTQRIIDVRQMGLFRRETSEFRLDKVQDITVDVPNFTATMLKYGNITIQTAGESSFKIDQIPNVNDVKNMIMDYSSNMLKNERAQQVGTDKI